MANLLAPVAKAKFFDNNGRPAAGYKLFTYEAGTSTKLATYTDETTGTPNSNPVVLDFRGEANVWIPPNTAYKFVFAPPTDTDPPTAPIWTVDDIVDSQLVTLWGGVDTGIANAYVLNFTSNFTSYTDGIVIYWIPSNTNTGASTINVNGLGPVPITNQDGSPLYLGQLQADQVALIVYRSSGFTLVATALLPLINTENGNYTFALSDANNIVMQTTDDTTIFYTIPPDSTADFAIGTSIQVVAAGNGGIVIQAGTGVSFNPFASPDPDDVQVDGHAATIITKISANTWVQTSPSNLNSSATVFTGTLTGMTTTIQGNVNVNRVGNVVFIDITSAITGTSNSTAMTLTGIPAAYRPTTSARILPSMGMQDNGSQVGGVASVSTAGVITFGVGINNNTTGFTGSGFKGLQAGWTLAYAI